MSFDDELRARMQAAAEQAGQSANPAAAMEHLSTSTAAPPPRTGPGLKLIAGLGGLGLVAGIGFGATVLRDGGDAVAQAATIEASYGGVWDCPDGRIVDNLRSGDRVFVVGRDAAGDWSAIRNPRSVNDVVWVPDRALDADEGASVGDDDLPVAACATPAIVGGSTTTTSTSTSTSTTTVAPTTTAPGVVPDSTSTAPPTPTTRPPTPTTVPSAPTTATPTTAAPTTVAPDTQNPAIQASSNVSEIYDASWSSNCDSVAQLTAFATDNIGVTTVQASYTGLPNSPINMTFSNGAWRGSFGPFVGLAANYNQLITITLTARDAAGNQTSTNVQVRVWGTCLI